MKNEMKIFEGKEVEVIVVNEVVLFNARNVGTCLELSDSAVRSAISKMSDKQAIKLTNSNVQDLDFRKLHNTGENFLTERGVYKLVLRSNKKEAEKFQDWICDDVLPSIEKTGGYIHNEEKMVEYLFADESDEVKSMMTTLFNKRKLEEERHRNEIQDKLNVINDKNKTIDNLTSRLDTTMIQKTGLDYMRKYISGTNKTEKDFPTMWINLYNMLGAQLQKNIFLQHKKFIENGKKLVLANKNTNKELGLRGEDKLHPCTQKEAKVDQSMSIVKFICTEMNEGHALLQVMAKMFDVGIEEVLEKYNYQIKII